MIKRSGYFWQSYGFTKLHMWGTFITAGMAIFIATLFLGMAIIDLIHGQAEHHYIFLYASIASALIAIEIVLFSALMLLFFLGADKLGLLENDKIESISAKTKE